MFTRPPEDRLAPATPSRVQAPEPDASQIHSGLRHLLEVAKKRQARKVARGLVITSGDLARLAVHCGALGYSHRGERRFFPLKQHKLTLEEARALHNCGGGALNDQLSEQAAGKICAEILERRRLIAHLFSRPDSWHCFYFSDEDSERRDGNHWEGGQHVHYVSHLWANLTERKVWKDLGEREIRFSGEHIRLVRRFPFPLSSEEVAARLKSPGL